jgi:hypothetical protein
MNRDDIFRMAREAGGYESTQYPNSLLMDAHDLERFAALVAERDTALLRQCLEALEGRAVNRYMERLDETITALRDRLGEKT